MVNIFDIVPENFFSLLSSKNKRLYVSCIIEIFKIYETGSILGIDKKIIVDDLTHFLENETFSYTNETEDDDEEHDISSKRDLANYILRRMEECGWIYIDVTNDYIEILNFSDAGITIIEALMQLTPRIIFDDNGEMTDEYYQKDPNEYQGYIYTIYTLLTNKENLEYGIIMTQVYKNTKLLIRSLRKLDSRLKDYISSVVEAAEIKELMEKLISYKTELVDNNYTKLKTSDNVNKYRLTIVNKLEEYQNNDFIMKMIALDYQSINHNEGLALKRANRDIDEIIDVFNSLDDLITEIDFKNKTYINSTIGKIKFLLSEDDNVIGKLNSILKFIKEQNKIGKLDKAMTTVSSLFQLKGNKVYNGQSLYTPRGNYSHNYNQILDMTRFDELEISEGFMDQFIVPYNEILVGEFLDKHLVNDMLRASDMIHFNTDDEIVMQVIYSVLYACDRGYSVELLADYIYHSKFTMKDFVIRRKV